MKNTSGGSLKAKQWQGNGDNESSSSSPSSSSKKRKRMDAKTYLALFELPKITTEAEGLGHSRTPKTLHANLKCKLSKLIKVLELPDNMRCLAEQLLEYLLENHIVVREPRGVLNAFNIALCWRAASRLKYDLDHRHSLALGAIYLDYERDIEELAEMFYQKLATVAENVVRRKPYEISDKVVNATSSSERAHLPT